MFLGIPGTSHHRTRSAEPHGHSDDADSAHWGARGPGGPDRRREDTRDDPRSYTGRAQMILWLDSRLEVTSVLTQGMHRRCSG